MTFKEFKKENNLSDKEGYWLELDDEIMDDILDISGWFDLKESIREYYGEPAEYLNEGQIDILNYEYLPMNDSSWDRLYDLTEGEFDKTTFFDNYTVEKSYEHTEFGKIIKLIKD